MHPDEKEAHSVGRRDKVSGKKEHKNKTAVVAAILTTRKKSGVFDERSVEGRYVPLKKYARQCGVKDYDSTEENALADLVYENFGKKGRAVQVIR